MYQMGSQGFLCFGTIFLRGIDQLVSSPVLLVSFLKLQNLELEPKRIQDKREQPQQRENDDERQRWSVHNSAMTEVWRHGGNRE
jgi:hypothetical protein